MLEAGFSDAWERTGRGVAACFTCCQEKDLRNAVSALDERIDFVLVRDARAPRGADLPGAVALELVGEEDADRTAVSGLWPSDHAGLVATLRLPRGLPATD